MSFIREARWDSASPALVRELAGRGHLLGLQLRDAREVGVAPQRREARADALPIREQEHGVDDRRRRPRGRRGAARGGGGGRLSTTGSGAGRAGGGACGCTRGRRDGERGRTRTDEYARRRHQSAR
jgi:hypothetical protein